MKLLLLLLAPLAVYSAEVTFWVQKCTRAETGCIAGDEDLARWALADWARMPGSNLRFHEVPRMEDARIRIFWAGGREGLYGEMRPFPFAGGQGAAVYIRPDTKGLGRDVHAEAARDPLYREAIVYLTCLHESGHALNLPHTADFADIMYSFQFGGDIPEYFRRYRRKLKTRDSIRAVTGTSVNDAAHLAALQ